MPDEDEMRTFDSGFWERFTQPRACRRLALFLGGGVSVLVLFSLIWKDILKIYNLQRDLVVGTFFSLTTFFLARIQLLSATVSFSVVSMDPSRLRHRKVYLNAKMVIWLWIRPGILIR
jgi:hypothetical protein